MRPQATFMLSAFGSGFVGVGLSWEFYLTKQFIFIPSFSPGIYWKGRGRDLGCPLEFRSCVEFSYEMKNKIRIGIQVIHVSNAHLSHKNPGFNALTLCVGIPLK
jgi:lipid A 3-O-deacylase